MVADPQAPPHVRGLLVLLVAAGLALPALACAQESIRPTVGAGLGLFALSDAFTFECGRKDVGLAAHVRLGLIRGNTSVVVSAETLGALPRAEKGIVCLPADGVHTIEYDRPILSDANLLEVAVRRRVAGFASLGPALGFIHRHDVWFAGINAHIHYSILGVELAGRLNSVGFETRVEEWRGSMVTRTISSTHERRWRPGGTVRAVIQTR